MNKLVITDYENQILEAFYTEGKLMDLMLLTGSRFLEISMSEKWKIS